MEGKAAATWEGAAAVKSTDRLFAQILDTAKTTAACVVASRDS